MTIAVGAEAGFARDRLSGASRPNLIDRWIYVFTAASLIAVVLAGFIPDSIAKVAAMHAGQRAPFPLILHVHAVLMASFLLLLLGQTVLVAIGRRSGHMQLGIAALGLTPLIVLTGVVLAPTIYHGAWNAAQAAPPAAKPQFQGLMSLLDDVLLLQLRSGIMFSIFIAYFPPPELTPGPYVSDGTRNSLKTLMSRHMLDAGTGAGFGSDPMIAQCDRVIALRRGSTFLGSASNAGR